MSETPGLSIPLSITLAKYEAQLARAEASAVKRAKAIEQKFNEANGRSSEGITKSAAASAQVFERAIQKETAAFQQLKASVDPAYAAQLRYESAVRQVQSAVRMGAITQKDANGVLEMARAKHLGVAAAAQTHAVSAGRMFNVSGAGRAVLQNTTNQFADMAVQIEMGTNPMRIMGQQLPQLFAGFGMLGGALGILAPLLGTVAAIGFPIAAVLLAQGDAAKESADKIDEFAKAFDKAESAISRANSAVSLAVDGDLDTLRKMYGEVSAEVQSVVDALGRLETKQSVIKATADVNEFFAKNDPLDDLYTALEERQRSIDDLKYRIGSVEAQFQDNPQLSSVYLPIIEQMRADLDALNRMDGISEKFSIDPASLATIKDARDALKQATDTQDIQGMIASIVKMRAVLATIPDGPLADMGDQLAAAESTLRRALVNVERISTASGSINFDNATASASAMADELNRAADAMHSLNRQGKLTLEEAQIKFDNRNDPIAEAGALAALEFDRQTAPLRKAGFENVGEEAFLNQQRQQRIDQAREIARLNEASRPDKPERSGRKSGGGRKRQEFDLFANSDREITALERQIEMFGKSNREVVALTAKYELLDKARERGIDLDQRSVETGRTVRDEIERHAEAVADLTIKADKYAEQARFMGDITEDLKDGLIDSILEGKNFGDVLDDVAKSLARAALQAALFGDGPLSGLFGGGGSKGGGGGIGSILAGGLFKAGLGFYAKGTNFAPGGAAIVGEDGPELVHLPRGSKVIPNSRIGQDGGRSQVDVFVHPSGEFDTRVQRISGDVAVNVSGQMISQNNRQVSQMQRR
ncbi:MAG: hypothetical protein H5U19_07760 [Rhodobacteraceae bacterium]|nr:hypothetical protein [Paracoccaceae bacterium]